MSNIASLHYNEEAFNFSLYRNKSNNGISFSDDPVVPLKILVYKLEQ